MHSWQPAQQSPASCKQGNVRLRCQKLQNERWREGMYPAFLTCVHIQKFDLLKNADSYTPPPFSRVFLLVFPSFMVPWVSFCSFTLLPSLSYNIYPWLPFAIPVGRSSSFNLLRTLLRLLAAFSLLSHFRIGRYGLSQRMLFELSGLGILKLMFRL